MRARINISNYEEWFMAFLEHELDAGELRSLEEFLSHHPALEEELNLLKGAKPFQSDAVEAINFNHLKKPVFIQEDEEVQDKLIALMEGDLSDAEKRDWEVKVEAYPELKASYALFLKTRLMLDPIGYGAKNTLKKKVAAQSISLYPWMRIAAVLLLLPFLIYFLREADLNKNELASNGSNPIVKLETKRESAPFIKAEVNKPSIQDLPYIDGDKNYGGEKSTLLKREKTNLATIDKKEIEPKAAESKLEVALPDYYEFKETQPYASAEAAGKKTYNNPVDFLLAKIKKELPEAGYVVKRDVNEMENKSTLAITASRYFSFEKVSYQKHN